MSLSSLLTSALAEAAGAGSLLVASDFDGVLAPIVLDPSASRPLPGTVESLTALAALPGTYAAVVSGRDLAHLGALTGLGDQDAVTLIGSHGAESSLRGPDRLTDAEQQVLHRLTADLEDLAASSVDAQRGPRLEHKPAAVVLHTRGMPDDAAAAAEAAALEVATRHTGVTAMRGKHVVELSVHDADKGSAVAALREARGAEVVVYLGDDVTDEHVFERLRAGDVGVKVGPGETAAQWRVDHPADAAAVLTVLLDRRRAR